MRAFRITSSEYWANRPSIFLMAGGKYYGCLNYPKIRNYPQDVDYWRSATCADSDRHFNVEEVEVNEHAIMEMGVMHTYIDELRMGLKDYAAWKPLMTKKEREAYENYNREICEYNSPIEEKISRYAEEIRNMIVGLKNKHNNEGQVL